MTEEERNEHDWLRLLAGGEVMGAQTETVTEARALRQVIVEEIERGEERAREALLQRLRREGLLPVVPVRPKRWWRRPRVWFPALAASLGAVVLVMPLLRPGPTQEAHPTVPVIVPKNGEVMQPKSFVLPQTLVVDDPAVTAGRLAAALSKAGAIVRQEQQEGRYYLDIQLPAQRSAPLEELLRRERIRPSADGKVLVEIVARTG